MSIITRRVQRAAAAAVLACAALPAYAATFEFDWGFRWSIGNIAHTTDVADSDPAPFRAVYEDAILDYRFDAFDFFDYYGFEGHGGTLIIDGQDPACRDVEACSPRTFTFQFGQARAHVGDTANYWLVAAFPFRDPDLNHAPRFDMAWVEGMNGTIYNDGGVVPVLGAMSEFFETRHLLIAGPVPEPETWALFALGAGVMGWAARRRRAAPPTAPRCVTAP